jgi:hypothetical protein
MVMPGDNIKMVVTLIEGPIAMEDPGAACASRSAKVAAPSAPAKTPLLPRSHSSDTAKRGAGSASC